MASVLQQFTNNIAITITLASLTNGSYATSNTIDNSSSAYISADVQVRIKTGTGTATTGSVTLFLLRSVDGGTTFDDASTNSEILGVFNANVDSTSYTFSIDTTVAGTLPSYWKLAVRNDSGATFDTTGANFFANMTGKAFVVS